MAYLDSSKIKVFPSAYRESSVDAESFYTTENNLTKTGTLGLASKSFVEDDGTNLTIVIKGYRFEAKKSDIVAKFSSPDKIYAGIKLVKKGSNDDFNTLVSYVDGASTILDDNSQFVGICFSDSALTGEYIQILEKNGTSYRVPNLSRRIAYASQITDDTSGKNITEEINVDKVVASTVIINSADADAITTKSLTAPNQTGNYATCSTAASTQAKVVSLSDFALTTGVHIFVKFTNGNSVSSPTLNVNGTGAKTIKFTTTSNTSPSMAQMIKENQICEFVYSGSVWVMLGQQCVPNVFSVSIAGSTPTSYYGGANYDGSEPQQIVLYANPTVIGSEGDILVSSGTHTIGDQPSRPNWVNPSSLTVGKANALGTVTVGSVYKPVYFSDGVPKEINYSLFRENSSGSISGAVAKANANASDTKTVGQYTYTTDNTLVISSAEIHGIGDNSRTTGTLSFRIMKSTFNSLISLGTSILKIDLQQIHNDIAVSTAVANLSFTTMDNATSSSRVVQCLPSSDVLYIFIPSGISNVLSIDVICTIYY